MKLPKLLTGTIVAFLILLATDYLYYGLINDTPTPGAAWGPKILYGLFYSLGFAYIYIKSAAIRGSTIAKGLMVGLGVGVLVLSIRVFMSNAADFAPGADGAWVIIQNVIIAVGLSYLVAQDPCADGIGGQGGDDDPRNP